MHENNEFNKKENVKVDIFRDTPIRLLGYSHFIVI